VAYHNFEGITVHAEEGARILASSAGKPVLFLRNHGPVVIGTSLAQAFNLMWLVNRACEVQVASQALGALQPITEKALEACVIRSTSTPSSVQVKIRLQPCNV
jgi:ribulose-5-phosphate 4-epimerase/fuculose-1-phosphate aldolase